MSPAPDNIRCACRTFSSFIKSSGLLVPPPSPGKPPPYHMLVFLSCVPRPLHASESASWLIIIHRFAFSSFDPLGRSAVFLQYFTLFFSLCGFRPHTQEQRGALFPTQQTFGRHLPPTFRTEVSERFGPPHFVFPACACLPPQLEVQMSTFS